MKLATGIKLLYFWCVLQFFLIQFFNSIIYFVLFIINRYSNRRPGQVWRSNWSPKAIRHCAFKKICNVLSSSSPQRLFSIPSKHIPQHTKFRTFSNYTRRILLVFWIWQSRTIRSNRLCVSGKQTITFVVRYPPSRHCNHKFSTSFSWYYIFWKIEKEKRVKNLFEKFWSLSFFYCRFLESITRERVPLCRYVNSQSVQLNVQ